MKANLARFTVALSLLATMAVTLAAGLKWNSRAPRPPVHARTSTTPRCDPAPRPASAGRESRRVASDPHPT